MDNWKIGDKCFYMYGNNPKEGRIKNITFYGQNGENGKVEFSHYKVFVNSKEALMMHLDNLLEKSTNNYKRLENGKNSE